MVLAVGVRVINKLEILSILMLFIELFMQILFSETI